MSKTKLVILAGGLGTRLTEETSVKPKPMVEIGQMPILWHIMKMYSHYNINDFIICCGYKGEVIKQFFQNYAIINSNLHISLKENSIVFKQNKIEDWKITLLDTGEKTLTGGRLKRVKEYLKDEEFFCFTYGDGVSDVNIGELIKFHKNKKVLATLTAVFPPSRFGSLHIENDFVKIFREKPNNQGNRINGGFFVLSPDVIDLIDNDQTTWEKEPMEKLAKSSNLAAFKHNGFWQPMDTLHDKKILNDLWSKGEAPWKVWK